MPYSQGPYERFTSLPVPPRPKVYQARKIDFATRRYSLDTTTGGLQGMSAAVQRLIILGGRHLDETKFNTAPERERMRKTILDDIKILTDKPDAVIAVHEVLVASEFPGSMTAQIRFTDLTSDDLNAHQVVQLP